MKVIVDNYLFESLKPSEFRKLMQVGRNLAMERIGGIWDKLKSQADGTNRNGDRLFFEISASPLEDKLHRYLKANNYEIVDYKEGLVKKVGDKNNVKIVKVLMMLGKNDPTAVKLQRNYELLKSVNKLNDYDSAKSESAVAEDYIMVISKSPYDLGGMTTGRDWADSCMNLRGAGIYKNYVPIDVERGTLVSYLVDPMDKNIKNPTARILIKPYLELDNKDEVLYGIQHGKVKYGLDNPEYVKTLINILDKAQEEKTGIFKLDNSLYHDGGKQFIVFNPKDTPAEKLLEYFGIKKYTINEDGMVDVDGSVDLSHRNLTEIPIKFGVVKGNFNVKGNNLLSLKNCPREVNGTFDCSFNKQLTLLKWGPKEAQSYYCNYCDLKSLEGAPNEILYDFNCSYNSNLTSLKYGPKIVGDYNCSNCNLTSLKGGPKSVENYYCYNCKLKTLEGAPNVVTGEFNCSENHKLISLINGPISAENYNCSGCNLTNLEGAPNVVTGEFNCSVQVSLHDFTEEDVKDVCNVGGKIMV
jgi:hypothetical protein